jgi:hypothetical protein
MLECPASLCHFGQGLSEPRHLELGHNYAIWGTPGSTVNNTLTFGKITSQANSPRQLQLSAKITF